MKIRALAFVLVVAGCASPQNASRDPLGGAQPDLATDGTGGNGGDVDMSDGSGGGGGGGGGGGVVVDMAVPPPDLAMPPRDMAQPPAPPDLATACVLNVPTSTCGIFPQCGCTSDPTKQNCNVEDNTTGKASCAAAGSTPDWNNCSGNGDAQCGVGRTCVDGVCSPFCGAVSDCPGSYRDCFQVVNQSSQNIPGLKVCSSFCDPTNPQNSSNGFMACGPNVNCYPGSDRIPYCTGPTTASGTQGADCTASDGKSGDNTLCAPSFACVTITVFGSTFYECEKFCHVGGASSECPSNTKCSSFGTKQYAGGQEIGGCG